VIKQLLRQGADCLAFDNLRTGHRDLVPEGVLGEGDIGDRPALMRAFEAFRPDAVIHLAAMATLSECTAEPEACRRTNIEGTANVLAAMQAHAVETLVFASSCAVYAPVKGMERLHEGSALGPASLYGSSKAEGEKRIAASGVRAMMLRIFNVAGADAEGGIGERHACETHLVPLAIEAAFGTRPQIYLYGNDYPTPDGTPIRDYIHVSDVAEAAIRCMHYLQGGGQPQALNLGSGTGVSVKELIAAVEKYSGRTIPTQVKERREGDVACLLADSSHLHRVLGWKPERSGLDTIVQNALSWHRKGIG